MMRWAMLLQVIGTAPPDFDLRSVRSSADHDAIVVTGRRPIQRIERDPAPTEPPMGRAEIPLFGKVRGDVRLESGALAGGATSQRVMVGVKLPF
jgi:hypothetical protein